MAYTIMPTMPLSMAKGLKKTPNFNTIKQKSVADRSNSAVALKPYATWDFEFSMDSITGHEQAAASTVAVFFGTFMACQAGAALFLFTDPQDSSVTVANSGMLNVTPGAASPMGVTGDGASTKFQLARVIGGVAYDIIQNLNGNPGIRVGGVLKTLGTDYSISTTGVVTFVAAPANLAALTWSGNFYFLCRFADDSLDSTRSFTINSGTDQWMVQGVKFTSEFV